MKDPKTEQFLNQGGWKWDYRAKVPLSDIDLQTSRDNPSRLLHDLDDDRVISYGLAMADGVEFPALVLLALDPALKSTFKYEIATGCHRVAAAQLASLSVFDAYIVAEPDQYRKEVLIRRLNTIEGHGVSIRDRVLQILRLHEAWPDRSLQLLAKEWNIKYTTVRAAHTEQQATKRAHKFGFEITKGNKLTQKSLMSLNSIHSDPAFQKVMQFVVLHSVSSAEIEEVVKEIKQTRDDKGAIAVVEQHIQAATERKLQAQAKHTRISPAGAGKFMQDARRLQNLLDKGIENLHLAAHPRRDLARSIAEQLVADLKRVVADIDRIERMKNIQTVVNPAGLGLH